MKTTRFSRITILALGVIAMLSLAAAAAAQSDMAGRKVALRASLDYYYGDWNQGSFDLDPRIGMIGPQVDVYFLEGKLGTGVRYISGDFDGYESVSVPSESFGTVSETFGSRKEMTLDQSREDVYVYAIFHPLSWLGLQAGYKYLDYQLSSGINLVSDVRSYGAGSESYRSEARGAVLGASITIPVRTRWALLLTGQAMPWLDTEVRGSYSYELAFEDRRLADDWSRNGNAVGWYGEAALEFSFPGEPVALHLGYVYQRVDSDEDVDPTWVDDSLGQGARDWQKEEFSAMMLGVKFRF